MDINAHLAVNTAVGPLGKCFRTFGGENVDLRFGHVLSLESTIRPSNKNFNPSNIPKEIGGHTPA